MNKALAEHIFLIARAYLSELIEKREALTEGGLQEGEQKCIEGLDVVIGLLETDILKPLCAEHPDLNKEHPIAVVNPERTSRADSKS